ncbi:MAG: hypothetical protein AAF806_15550 [Bacteroidota bacterium]
MKQILICLTLLFCTCTLFAQNTTSKDDNRAKSNTPVVIDFTDPNTAVFGTDIRVVVNGVALLPSGDVDSDGDVDINDYDDSQNDDDAGSTIDWLNFNSQITNYSVNGGADLNLDGVINAIDLNYYLFPNLGKTSQIPN